MTGNGTKTDKGSCPVSTGSKTCLVNKQEMCTNTKEEVKVPKPVAEGN